jgi:hypothetical protein
MSDSARPRSATRAARRARRRQTRRSHVTLIPAAHHRPGAARPHGWLKSDGSDRAKDAPHTKTGHRLPTSKLAFIMANASIGFRMKKTREAGIAPR